MIRLSSLITARQLCQISLAHTTTLSFRIQPLLRGGSSLIHFTEDFLICFTNKADAERVVSVLPKRLYKYGLTLHPDKNRLIDLNDQDNDKRGFDLFRIYALHE